MKKITYKELIVEILNIIGYQNDKSKFATEFELLNRIDAVGAIITSYPEIIQNRIKACLNAQELSHYIPQRTYEKAYIEITQKALQDFIISIEGTLSLKQIDKIKNVILSY